MPSVGQVKIPDEVLKPLPIPTFVWSYLIVVPERTFVKLWVSSTVKATDDGPVLLPTKMLGVVLVSEIY